MIMALENYDELTKVRKNARKIIINEYSYDTAIDKWGKIISDINT